MTAMRPEQPAGEQCRESRDDDREPVRPGRLALSLTFDFQPVLKGRHVYLRPLHSDDYEALYQVASDPLIWEQHPERDRYKPEVFEDFFRVALDSGGALVALDAGDGRVIGSSRYHGYHEQNSEVEIGWTFLARSHWGGIYNGEMKMLMLRHAFRFVDRVVFHIGSDNFRSQKAVEKIGALRAGRRDDGGGRESYVFELTAARFKDPG